jgi:hypothetical protein
LRDFTLEQYRLLCEAFTGYNVYTVAGYLEEKPQDSFIILRHDVDRSPLNALRMAALEAEMDISSTYYFRCGGDGFPIDYVEAISRLGHEVGYHYEVLSKAKGDTILAEKLFVEELTLLRKYAEVKTVSMHGKPLSPYSNLVFLVDRDFRVYDLIGDATLSIIDDSIFYLTDTGRNWRGKSNIRDYSDLNSIQDKIENTGYFTDILNRKKINYYFNIHPERWGYDFTNWCFGFVRDFLFNFGKLIIKIFR